VTDLKSSHMLAHYLPRSLPFHSITLYGAVVSRAIFHDVRSFPCCNDQRGARRGTQIEQSRGDLVFGDPVGSVP
jgi:hypothetical protein